MKDFERKIARLEELAEKMREPDLPLETSFAYFEEGIALARELKKNLNEMQAKVEILLNSVQESESALNESPQIDEFEANTLADASEKEKEES
jgi:exodeoxyribonuclease VII small subunit